jgi:glutamine amidotransferase
MSIAIVDMRVSNLASVLQALAQIKAPAHRFATPENIEDASAIVLPGVGAFGDGMTRLTELGLVEPLRRAARAGVPFLGICLGMQLMADRSEEFGLHEGLGLVPGEVKKLVSNGPESRVPNIGWCDVTTRQPSVFFPTPGQRCLYHIHSYHIVPADNGIVTGTIDFAGSPHVVTIEAGNLFGVQFHPEKSQADGLDVLANFFAVLPRLQAGRRL